MNNNNDNEKIHNLNILVPKVEVKPHPPEVMELDELTIAIAKAKFAGMDFDDIYGDSDRISSELRVKIQAQKIRDLFETMDQIRFAFSSEQKKNEALKDLLIDGIDLEFVKTYCKKKQLEFSDDAEALIKIAFEATNTGHANV